LQAFLVPLLSRWDRSGIVPQEGIAEQRDIGTGGVISTIGMRLSADNK